MALTMLCVPILLSAHGVWAEHEGPGAAEHVLVEACPLCELCDSIPGGVHMADPLPVRLQIAAQKQIDVSLWVSTECFAAYPAAPRAPPFQV